VTKANEIVEDVLKILASKDVKKIQKLSSGKYIVKTKEGRKKVFTINNEASKTDQQWKQDVDVNSIMKKYISGKGITHLAKIRGTYADVSNVPDLATAMQQLKTADELFMGLPAALRAKFENDPAKMVEYLQDPKNNEEAVKLGLKTKVENSDEQSAESPATSQGGPKNEVSTDAGKTESNS
jgi:phage internal scaffolding protein